MSCYCPAYPAVQQAPAWTPREQGQRLDQCAYVPGVYRFPTPPPTPSAILNGVYRSEERIEYFPRRPEFCGRPLFSIPFSVHGHPGPYLKDILKDRVLLDGAQDAVMGDTGWSRTRWVLEWPGYDHTARGLAVAGLSRTALAKEVATCVAIFLRDAAMGPAPLGEKSPWSARNVHFGDVRLVAMNYYSRVWIPVLAFDAT
ncbi:hypothetical protein MVEN_01074600 [Mycena venus]|uniref:Uncharacterized protein n=1 Tax=Mycena venus TaxID=2733690 RepID=A0A8H6Y8M5_9AGAR|nr:hypothetical protein MVEN_01074600 [Mycena venus]